MGTALAFVGVQVVTPDAPEERTMNASWINGAEAAAPGANTQLVKIVCSPGKIGRVYGFRIVSQEANAAGKVWRLRSNVQGQSLNLALCDVTNPTYIADVDSELAVIKGNGVDFFEVINVVVATASTIHQASILYEETDS